MGTFILPDLDHSIMPLLSTGLPSFYFLVFMGQVAFNKCDDDDNNDDVYWLKNDGIHKQESLANANVKRATAVHV